MAQLKKFQTVPYLKKIIWQPYNDNNQPEKSMEFEPECAVILSTDAWEELAKEKQNVDVCESMLIAKDLETKCLNKELAGHKRGEEILSEANRQLEKELAAMKAENEVLKMTIAHYKSSGNIKF